jgi:hypothetical protein
MGAADLTGRLEVRLIAIFSLERSERSAGGLLLVCASDEGLYAWLCSGASPIAVAIGVAQFAN